MEDDDLYSIAKEFLQKVTYDLDKETTRKGEIHEGDNEVYLLTPSHIQFAKYGRDKGKTPPLSPILSYVKRENILFKGEDHEGTAEKMRWIIAKNGTKNFVKDAPNFLEEVIQRYESDYVKQISKETTIQINKKLQKYYKKAFPESRYIKY